MTLRLTSRRSPLSNDQCLQVLTLYESCKTRQEITQQLRLDPRQDSKAIKRGHTMPPRPSSRPQSLTSDQVDEVEEFVCSCRESRQMTYLKLAMGTFKEWGVSEQVIRNNLIKRGYSRHRAVSKPRLTEATRNKRKQWAEVTVPGLLRLVFSSLERARKDWTTILRLTNFESIMDGCFG